MNECRLKPLNDRVVMKPSEAEKVTPGGIVLPDTAKEKPTRGTVLAVGPGKLLDSGERGKLSVAVGDEVIYNRYSGSEIEIDGREVKIIHETDILAVVEKQKQPDSSKAAPIEFYDRVVSVPIIDGEMPKKGVWP